jgi:hypothetical protein
LQGFFPNKPCAGISAVFCLSFLLVNIFIAYILPFVYFQPAFIAVFKVNFL